MISKMAFWTFLALLFLVVPAVAETPITGTSVLLEPPAGYRAAESYTGLESEDDTWWLMVMEVPVPIAVDELVARMTDSAMAEKEMVVKGRELLETRLGPSTLLTVEQEQDGATYEKLVLFVGDEKRAVTVTVGYLLESSEELREAMLASLRTVRLAEERGEVNLEGLPFTYEESAELAVEHRALASLILLPTDENKEDVFLGLSALEPGDGAELEAVMRGELESVYDQLLVEESMSLELQGAPALEVLATGLDPKSGEKVSVYYLLVSGPNPELYFSAYGETPHGKMGEWLEKFRQVSHSLRARYNPVRSRTPTTLVVCHERLFGLRPLSNNLNSKKLL